MPEEIKETAKETVETTGVVGDADDNKETENVNDGEFNDTPETEQKTDSEEIK